MRQHQLQQRWGNWDHVAPFDGNIYDCDGPPVAGLGLSAGDYMNDECGPTFTDGTANEYDYQRFLWDLVDKAPPAGATAMTVDDVYDVIDAACANPPWNSTYEAAFPANLDNPRDRLYDAASGFGATWDAQDDYNGVHR